MTPKCSTQNQASCLLCKARGGFCIDKLYNLTHTEGILAMPDLIALSWSLYALSQNKNDPNTNPEIISCSRKDIFVDISWVTAKKIFFFSPIHPFKVLLQTQPKLFGSHQKWPKYVPPAKSSWGEGAPVPSGRAGCGQSLVVAAPSPPHLGLLAGPRAAPRLPSLVQGEEEISVHVLSKEQIKAWKAALQFAFAIVI